MHYLDEGEPRQGTMLLLHGEPSWSFLYRNLIPVFTAAGYRANAPDMIGFGRSDKVTKPEWYTLDAHVSMLRGLIELLDLRSVTLVCQDWGGPIGLVNAVDMPERFSRLVILNTWLHRPDFPYTPALKAWNERSQSVDFSRMGAGPWIIGSPDDPETLQAGYSAPFPIDMPEAQTGAFRWPWMLPFVNPVEGGAERQARAYAELANWPKPAHVFFGELDLVFPPSWGEEFARHIPGATFDVIPGAGHMVQEVGAPLAELILTRVAAETTSSP
jgi:pimeloyl-ACP methyl ester carboxylesterase